MTVRTMKSRSSKSFAVWALLSLAILSACASAYVQMAPTAPELDEANEAFPGKYIVKDIQHGDGQLNATIQYQGTATYYLRDTNKIVKNIRLRIIEDDKSEMGFILEDMDQDRFNLPYREPFPFTKVKRTSEAPLYAYSIAAVGEEFWIQVTRKSTGETLFDSRKKPIIYTDRYLYIASAVENEYIYGVGQRNYGFHITPGERGEFTFWNKDQPCVLEKGAPDGQTYGHHPMYLRREGSGNFHVAFLRSSYGMQFGYQTNQFISFKVIGGIIEMKFFLGEKRPDQAITKYQTYINGWQLHPFWSMGFHQCRWGYTSSQALISVQEQYEQNKLPLDTIWSDIDYMEQYEDFTINTGNFQLQQMRTMMDLSSPQGVHWVPIIDAGISVRHAQYCLDHDCYIKSNLYDGQPLMGCVWPGNVHYPDFNHPKAWDMWHEGLANITANYGLTPSGFWIDMDEFANFVTGEIPPTAQCPPQLTEPAPLQNDVNVTQQLDREVKERLKELEGEVADARVGRSNPFADLPFNPSGVTHPLDEKTISLDAYFYNEPDAKIIHYPQGKIYSYDYHQLLGFTEGISTNSAMERMGYKLKFIVTRSQMFGAGKYMTLWQGDSCSTWEWLYNSIPYIFNMQMFSMPFTGSDICGFGGNTTAELCARWMTLGTLYPFSRNHNQAGSSPQEPYAFPDHPYVLEASRKGLELRYSLLKYYYHLYVKLNGTGTVFRPLFFEFPNDENLLVVDWEFMLGDALLAAPVLFAGDSRTNTTQEDVTFPIGETFYDYFTGTAVNKQKLTVIVPFDGYMPFYIRAGKIVHSQDVQGVYRSRNLNNVFQLRIALNANLQANGTFMTIQDYNQDETIIKRCIDNSCVARFEAQAAVSGSKLTIQLKVVSEAAGTQYQPIQIDKLFVYGIPYKGQAVFKETAEMETIVIAKPSTFSIVINLDDSENVQYTHWKTMHLKRSTQ